MEVFTRAVLSKGPYSHAGCCRPAIFLPKGTAASTAARLACKRMAGAQLDAVALVQRQRCVALFQGSCSCHPWLHAARCRASSY